MNKTEIYKKVIEIVSDVTGLSPVEIKPNSQSIRELKCEDLEAVEIAFAIEEEFGVKIRDEDAPKLTSVDDLVEFVVSNSQFEKPQD